MAITRPAAYALLALLALQCLATLPTARAGGGGGGGGRPRPRRPCCSVSPVRGCSRRCSAAEIASAPATGDYVKMAALSIAKVSNADKSFTGDHIQACLSRAVVTLSNVDIHTKAPANIAAAAVTQTHALAHELNRLSTSAEGLTVYVTKDVQVAGTQTQASGVHTDTAAQLHSDVAQAAVSLGNVQGCAAHSNAEFKFVATVNKVVNFNQPADACSDLEGAQIKGSFREADVTAQPEAASWKVFVSGNTCA